MVPTPHCDTDQSRIVYLVRLISIWYCKWFMLFMTLDMPDEGTAALAEDDNSEERAILSESGARPDQCLWFAS